MVAFPARKLAATKLVVPIERSSWNIVAFEGNGSKENTDSDSEFRLSENSRAPPNPTDSLSSQYIESIRKRF